MNLHFSIIIPVYNRPNEVQELLESLVTQTYKKAFEIVVVEDGSIDKADLVCKQFQDQLDINYFYKKNSGPGQSRNEGMKIAKGNYFIILDSDVLLPKQYLSTIEKTLSKVFTDAFTAPDCAHRSFTPIQKAINYAMTSFLTTGGLRNNKGSGNFQLRSFNMGLSKEAFIKTKGFSKQYFGEDIDLSIRLSNLGLKKQFIQEAFVYHKRRVDFKRFYKQTFNFGATRPVLNNKHKNTAKIAFWFPLLFVVGSLFAIGVALLGFPYLLIILILYLITILVHASIINKSMQVGILTTAATIVQFFGYGLGFLRSQIRLKILNRTTEKTFPAMFNK